jgi:hypothetical protein
MLREIHQSVSLLKFATLFEVAYVAAASSAFHSAGSVTLAAISVT